VLGGTALSRRLLLLAAKVGGNDKGQKVLEPVP
jgi:hypothetical protein